jgi:predicted Rossmann fold nucleotide-binding protein DprA/Smf involved in DNA uptake
MNRIQGVRKWDKSKFSYAKEHVCPPKQIFVLGRDWQVLNEEYSISFGGTVSPTADGFQLAELLAQEVVSKFSAIVIGGGVIGIDTAAHLGALDTHAKTVAVIANPVEYGLHPYQPKRHFFEDAILRSGGLIVSEYDTWSDDRKERLLQRDRVIAALSDVFVSVECSENSATVDSAKRAKIQGKVVLAVDWSRIKETWHPPEQTGATQLIRESIAIAFPNCEVDSIRDSRLCDQFAALVFDAYKSKA